MSIFRLNAGITQFTVSLLLGVVTSCSGYIDRRAAESTYAIVKGSKIAVQRNPDVEFARLAIPGGLVQLEAFHLAYPRHRGFLRLLAEGYCQYAMGFVYAKWERSVLTKDSVGESGNRTRALASLDRCRALGTTMLASSWQKIESHEQWKQALPRAKKKHVAGLSWVALGMVNTIALDPIKPERILELRTVKRILDRLVELDEAYNYATAHVMLGALACSTPSLLGGDTEEGREHFERARVLTGPGFLMNDVIFARTCLVSQGDRAKFRSTLRSLLASKTSQWPDSALPNALAAQKAQLYLQSEDTFFGPSD